MIHSFSSSLNGKTVSHKSLCLYGKVAFKIFNYHLKRKASKRWLLLGLGTVVRGLNIIREKLLQFHVQNWEVLFYFKTIITINYIRIIT